MNLAGICIAVAALTLCTASQAAQWIQTWGAAPLPPSKAMGPYPATPSFSNQTIRQIVRASVGGHRIRIRFTNEYGSTPLAIGGVRVALVDDNGDIRPGTDKPVLFSNKPSVQIPVGAPFESDPIDISIPALGSLSISIYLPEETGQCTCHQTAIQDAYVSEPGNFTGKAFSPKQTLQMRAFISGVDAEVANGGRAVVVLGDSISDGIGSTINTNHRWPDLLANRLNTKGRYGWGVVNMGISGNQLLNDGAGQSALARFDRDVLATPGVKAVIIFEGVNDLGIAHGHADGPMAEMLKPKDHSVRVTAESMIDGYRQLCARAHGRGLKVIGATITPYEGAFYYSIDGEAIRTAINAWIRTSHDLDAFIDFDAAMRDESEPTQIRNGFHMGDHLHASDMGYEAMAAAVNLSVLN